MSKRRYRCKAERERAREAKELGYDLKRTGANHLRATHPSTGNMVTLASDKKHGGYSKHASKLLREGRP